MLKARAKSHQTATLQIADSESNEADSNHYYWDGNHPENVVEQVQRTDHQTLAGTIVIIRNPIHRTRKFERKNGKSNKKNTFSFRL